MKQEDKELLLKDVCSRLPYKLVCEVKYKEEGKYKTSNMVLSGVFTNEAYFTSKEGSIYSTDYKPYLFPLSSMTEEIMDEIYNNTGIYDIDVDSPVHLEVGTTFEDLTKVIHILHKHHIDYRGLIPMDLAIDATGKNIY